MSDNDFPDMPGFLLRPDKLKSEVPMRKVTPVMATDEATAAAQNETEMVDTKAKKGQKSVRKARQAATPQAVTHRPPQTKPHRPKQGAAAKAKAKRAAPTLNGKKPAKKARAAPVRDPAKLDQFGFRKGSIKSQAAAMYAKGKGATLNDVKEALESTQYNLLTELKTKGYTITETETDGNGNRKLKRFKIVAK